MTSKKIATKRYSKRVVTSYNTNNSEDYRKLKDRLEELYGTDEEGRANVDHSFDGLINKIIRVSKDTLQKASPPLLSSLKVWRVSKESDWTEEEPNEPCSQESLLTSYVINSNGYKEDSFEGLSARMITAAHDLKTSETENQRLTAAYKLGRLTQLYEVYADNYSTAIKGSIEGNKKKNKTRRLLEIDTFINQLVTDKYEEWKHPELWDELISKMNNPETASTQEPFNPIENWVKSNINISTISYHGDGGTPLTYRRFKEKLIKAKKN